MPELTVKFLEHCEPGELIRVSFVPDSGSWGIVGYVQANGGPKKVVVIISGANTPRLVNEIEFATNAHVVCLSYGKDYLLLPRYDGACEVVSAQGVFAHAPTLIFACPIGISSTERYLIGTSFAFNLEQFNVGGQPGRNRAGFNHWSIWKKLPSHPDQPTKIFEYGQQ